MDIDAVSDLLVREEGEILHAYEDQRGYLTIGVGRLIDARRGGGISRAESRYMLAHDIDRCVEAARMYPWFGDLNDARQGVVVCMIFQLGTSGFEGFYRTRRYIGYGRYADAALEMLDSAWARQTPARARRMAAVMRSGEWGHALNRDDS